MAYKFRKDRAVRIADRVARGMTMREIAAELQMSLGNVHYHCAVMDIRKPFNRRNQRVGCNAPRLSDRTLDVETLRDLYSRGLSYRQIATRFGQSSPSTVHRWFKAAGIAPRQRGG